MDCCYFSRNEIYWVKCIEREKEKGGRRREREKKKYLGKEHKLGINDNRIMSKNVALKCMDSIASIVEYCITFYFTIYYYCPHTLKHPILKAFSLFFLHFEWKRIAATYTNQTNICNLISMVVVFRPYIQILSIWKTGGWFADAKKNNNNTGSHKRKKVERELRSIQKSRSNGSLLNSCVMTYNRGEMLLADLIVLSYIFI